MRPFVVVVDSREQEPYAFGPGVATTRRALEAGDYSVEGLEGRVAVERKSLEDYVGTVIRERERFARELGLLSRYDASCIVVEGGLPEILGGDYRSGAHPNSVVGATLGIMTDYRVPVVFAGDRPSARWFTERFLERCHRKMGHLCPT